MNKATNVKKQILASQIAYKRTQNNEVQLEKALAKFFNKLKKEVLNALDEYWKDYQMLQGHIDLITAPVHEAHKEYYELLALYVKREYRLGSAEAKRLVRLANSKQRVAGKSMRMPARAIIKKDNDLFGTLPSAEERLLNRTFTASERTLSRVDSQINQIITDGYRSGKGINDVANSLNQRFDQLTSWESKRIARTEIHNSHNTAVMDTYKELDVEYTMWIAAEDERTRDSHLEINGEIIPMGGWFIGWFNRYLTIPVFNWLKDNGVGFGLIILILTIIVKLIILPLTYKSYMSTAKMRAIRPEMEEINKKYPNKDDAMKKQQALMELYRKAGVSPMGGCLPLLIQMPILWAMFRFFPASIELRGEGFLWADDLSSYDSVLELPFSIPFYGDHVSLFALLMAVSLFGYSYISYKQQEATTAGQPGSGVMKFMMVYFMPVMMLFFFNSYSSGLCYYYFLSQMLTMLIMYIIRRSVDDNKVRERLLANAAKPRKKSKFQERYEEMLKQQQEQLNREQRRQRR